MHCGLVVCWPIGSARCVFGGPSGHEEKYGTKYAVERMQEMYAWDYASRQGNVNTVGFKIEVTEFDYKSINKPIYEENGVTIRTIPAIHAYRWAIARLSQILTMLVLVKYFQLTFICQQK